MALHTGHSNLCSIHCERQSRWNKWSQGVTCHVTQHVVTPRKSGSMGKRQNSTYSTHHVPPSSHLHHIIAYNTFLQIPSLQITLTTTTSHPECPPRYRPLIIILDRQESRRDEEPRPTYILLPPPYTTRISSINHHNNDNNNMED